jgi:hypothetical protein
MKKSFRKSIFIGISVLAVCALLLAFQPAPQKFRVGIFDSRAIAVAYVLSDLGAKDRANLMTKYEKAKADKTEKVTQEYEIEGKAQEQVAHLQGFSTASVMGLLEKVKDELPKVAKEAGVDMILSEWEVAFKNSEIETVDVTMALVKLFKPRETAFKTIEQLRKQQPLPLLDLIKQMLEGGIE